MTNTSRLKITEMKQELNEAFTALDYILKGLLLLVLINCFLCAMVIQ